MRELAVTARDFFAWADAARQRWSDERYARSLRDRTAFADEGEAFVGWEWLIPLVKDARSSIFEHLGETVFVVDEPGELRDLLSENLRGITERYREIEQADDSPCHPRNSTIDRRTASSYPDHQRVELRTLGRTAAEVDRELSLEAEAPKVQFGRSRGVRQPLFLFTLEDSAAEFDWQSAVSNEVPRTGLRTWQTSVSGCG